MSRYTTPCDVTIGNKTERMDDRSLSISPTRFERYFRGDGFLTAR